MNHTVRDLLIVAAGLCTSVITTVIIWLSLHYLHFSLYGSLVLVHPGGAILCGLVAGSGYYWASMKLHRKATALVLANLLSMAVSTYFVVQYLPYYAMAVNGQPLRDPVSFPAFRDLG